MNVKKMTDSSLNYVFKDCLEACIANPLNPKVPEYMETAKTCLDEIVLRGLK